MKFILKNKITDQYCLTKLQNQLSMREAFDGVRFNFKLKKKIGKIGSAEWGCTPTQVRLKVNRQITKT